MSPATVIDGGEVGASPADRALSRAELVAVAVALLVMLAVVTQLRAEHMLDTSTWGHDSRIFGVRFAIQLAVLFFGAMALQLVPERWARPLLVAEGAACLFVIGVPTAALYLTLLLIWYLALSLPIAPLLRVFLAGTLLVALGIGGRHLVKGAYGFSMMFALRLIVYAWEGWQEGFPRVRLDRYLLYVLAPPLIVLPPFLTIIPRFEKHSALLAPRLTVTKTRRVFQHLGLATGFAIFVALGRMLPGLETQSFGFLMCRYLLMIAAVAQVVHLSVALLLLHGMDDRPPMNNPLLARSPLEYWTRFQIHQKDFQLALFYTPSLFRLRKLNRYLAIMLALVWTLTIWNTIVHFVVRYMYLPRDLLVGSVTSAILISTLNAVAIGGTLCLHEWRRRNKRPPPHDVVWEGLSWFCTILFAARTSD